MTGLEAGPIRTSLTFCFFAGVALVLAPLFAIAFFEAPFITQTNTTLLKEFSNPWLWGLLVDSLRLAFYTTSFSIVAGIPLGLKLAARPSPFVKALGLAHILPLSLPPYIVGLGFASFTGQSGLLASIAGAPIGAAASSFLYSETGTVFVLGVSLSPIVTLSTALFARGLNPALLESALLMRRPSGVLTRIAIPLVAPGIALGALIVFVLAFSEVAVPQLLGLKVYATAVFTRLADLSFEPAIAIARSIPPVAIAALAATGLYFIDKRGRASSGLKAMLPNAVLKGGPGVFANLILVIMAFAGTLPLTALFLTAFFAPGGGFQAFFQGNNALLNSLIYALLGACTMLVIAIPSAWAWSKNPVIGGLAGMPLLLGFLSPAAILGTGLIVLWNRPETEWIYHGSGIMVLGLTARYAFLPTRAIKLGFDRTVKSRHEAALMMEPSTLKRFFSISFIGNLDAIAGGFAIAFITCFRDLDTVVLFYPPDGEPLCVRAMTIEANAPPGQTAATAALQVAVTTLLIAATYLLLKGKKR